MNTPTKTTATATTETATTTPGPRKAATFAQRIAALADDRGMSTVEYAMGSLAAAALAAVLYMVINGDGVTDAIESIITDALSNTPA